MSEPHSADFFGPLRDSWWNRDFLELLARRFAWTTPMRVLDAGCGQGHWGQVLSHVLPAGSSIVGIDREEESLAIARTRAPNLEYRVGDVLAIDFPDDTFDLVTCQTLLIHIEHPPDALEEMMRVLRHGGWIVCAEPNNLGGAIGFDSTSWNDPDAQLRDAEMAIRCEHGKALLGEGFSSAGELVAGWLAALNVESLQVYLSDKALPFYPPYREPNMRDIVDVARKGVAEQRFVWTKDVTRRYFLAGGGTRARFEKLWRAAMKDMREGLDHIERGLSFGGGGALMYVVGGRKV